MNLVDLVDVFSLPDLQRKRLKGLTARKKSLEDLRQDSDPSTPLQIPRASQGRGERQRDEPASILSSSSAWRRVHGIVLASGTGLGFAWRVNVG